MAAGYKKGHGAALVEGLPQTTDRLKRWERLISQRGLKKKNLLSSQENLDN
nr:MAG TPA: hypothetical protein [Caudoviricetes sp.]